MPKIAVDASVIINEQVSEDVFRLELLCPEIAAYSKPGMFVQVRVDKGMLLLRRPFGIADVKDKSITVFYRVLGEGTKALTSVKSGDLLNVLGPLGNGFKTDAKRPLLVGGGMGLAPLLYLARFYQGKADILMGGRNKQEIFWEEYFRPYSNNIFITT
ncbi:MAG: dihydroorotate dehydrogenase electron transfer subunit, partial [Schwartzia sp.]|nr:dihydroorotate dehydrogenase electron transfer subunit [Schwartzia sp. (in: firmicutes)]